MSMEATHTALLDIPQIPIAARQCHLFPEMGSKALLSIAQFVDNGYKAILTSKTLYMVHDTDPTMSFEGTRDSITRMWTINLKDISKQTNVTNNAVAASMEANNVYDFTLKQEIVKYLHCAAGSPVPSTWCEAIDNNHYATWPGLTSQLVRKHLPKSIATTKGHMRQIRQNVRSTKPKVLNIHDIPPTPSEMTMKSNMDNVRQNTVTIRCMAISGKLFSDQTGRFPNKSSRGNQYIMIAYDQDSNAILAQPIKTRSEHELLKAMTAIHKYLKERGLHPKLQILDNECPTLVKQFFKQENVSYQLVPPNLHRNNAAEKAIGTFKDHFVSILCSCDPNFPMHLWCRLVAQATTTLNLLRKSNINPRLSAEAQLNGAFDYNATPLAPPGCKVVIYENPEKRKTWAPHGIDGWYIGSAPEHYRCHTVYATKTRAERIARTVEFFPHAINMPTTSSTDNAAEAARMLADALLHPAPASPFLSLGNKQMRAIRQLSDLFSTTIPDPKPSTPLTAPIHKSQSPPILAPSPRVQIRQPKVPSPRVPIIIPPSPRVPVQMPPSRPHRIEIPCPKTTNAPAPRAPNLIEPDDDDPVSHRYPLRNRRLPHTRTIQHAFSGINDRNTRISQAKRQANALQHIDTLFKTEVCNSVIDEVSGSALEYRHLIHTPAKNLWKRALANDLGMLAQGVGTRIKNGTNTIRFIPRHAIPDGRKVTYARLVASLRPHKKEVHRVRVTVGGDRLEYNGITSTQTASINTTKCLVNSTLSTREAKFMSADIKEYYYGTRLKIFEYMRMALKDIPEEIIEQYDLPTMASDDWVYMQIEKGMPGLKQAGKIANDRLKKHLAKYGYTPVPRTPALWK